MLGDTARSASRPASSINAWDVDIVPSGNGVSSGGRSNATSARWTWPSSATTASSTLPMSTIATGAPGSTLPLTVMYRAQLR